MPLRKRDGTAIAPTGIAEVRKGDGTVIYSQGSAIPDSVVQQFDPATFTTGDSTWFDDAGSNDMSIKGDPQSSTLSNGDPSVSANGVDDGGLAAIPSELDGSNFPNSSFEFAVEFSDTGSQIAAGRINSAGPQEMSVYLNYDYSIPGPSDGYIAIRILDDSGNACTFSPSNDPNLNDGNRHRITVDIDAPSTSSYDLYIDGALQSLTFDTQANQTNFVAWDGDMGYFAQNDGGLTEFYDGELGIIRWHDSTIGGHTV